MSNTAIATTTDPDVLAQTKGVAKEAMNVARDSAVEVRDAIADQIPAQVKDKYEQGMGWLKDFLPENIAKYVNDETVTGALAGGFGLAVAGPNGAVMLGGLALAAKSFMDGDMQKAATYAGAALAGGMLGDGLIGTAAATAAGAFAGYITNDLLTGGGKTQELMANAQNGLQNFMNDPKSALGLG